MWKCARCGQEVDDEYEVCWACGTTIDGVEDPFFGQEPAETDPPGGEAQPVRLEERLITVGRFRTLPEALTLKARLEEEGVHAIVDGEHAIHVTSWVAPTAEPNYEVKILEGDAERARAVLSSE